VTVRFYYPLLCPIIADGLHWLPVGPMSLVLGAHTGPSMVGVAYAPLEAFAGMP